MYKKSVIVVLAFVLTLGLSGCVPTPKKPPQNTFAWNPKEGLIITTTGEPRITGYREFPNNELLDALPGLSRWGSPSLLRFTESKESLKKIKSSHTIFMIRPECLYDLENLEAEYPDLLPVSTEKLKLYLKTYGYPLLYFSCDSTGMLRGVVIAKKITLSLLTELLTKSIALDIPLRYEYGELKKAEKKKLENTFTWNYQERLIITVSGEHFVEGEEEFLQEGRKVLPRLNSWGTSRSLLYLVKNQYPITNGKKLTMEDFHNIFMIRPEYLYHFEELEAEYPHLMPDSYENLKSYLKTYSHPLLYFSFDTTKRKIRGVIIAKKVTPSLATKLLTEKAIPLNIPLQYEKEELKKAEKSQKKVKKTFTWNPKDPKERLIITVTARPRVNNYDEFAQEMRKVISTVDRWGAPSLLYWEGRKVKGETTELDIIRSHHTIFMISPGNLSDFEKLEAKYPNLLSVSTEKLKSYLKTYGYPLLYFSYDYTGMLRGVIIADEVTVSLAKLLTVKPIPLDTPLRYENGKLEKLEK